MNAKMKCCTHVKGMSLHMRPPPTALCSNQCFHIKWVLSGADRPHLLWFSYTGGKGRFPLEHDLITLQPPRCARPPQRDLCAVFFLHLNSEIIKSCLESMHLQHHHLHPCALLQHSPIFILPNVKLLCNCPFNFLPPHIFLSWVGRYFITTL